MRSIRPYAVFDRRSSPCRWAVDGASIWKRHYVWQLASGGQVARDVVAISSVESQVCWTLTRIENYCLPPEFVTHKVERRDEVRITRNDGKCFGRICVGIAKKRCGEIDISTFLFDLYHMDNVGYCLHRLTVKKKRSQTLRPKTSLRVGRTVRLDMNLLRGSVLSVSDCRMWRKGGLVRK